MILQGPSAVTFVPPQAQVVVQSVTFDLVAHRFVIVYASPSGPGQKVVSGPIPANVQTAIENHAQAAIEANEGWAAASSTVVSP